MKKLRIATFVTSHFTVPPPKEIIYAPMDIAISLSRGLATKGHRVDFFAPVGSRLPKTRNLNLVSLGLKPLRQSSAGILQGLRVEGDELYKIFNLWDQYFLSEIYRRALAGEYDLVHIHPIDRALSWGRTLAGVKTVYTLHDPISPWRARIFRMFASKNQYIVSISNNQRKPAPDLNYAGTVYNGIELNKFPFSEKSEEHFLFTGRIMKEKGAAEAVQAARKTGAKLLIVGPRSNDNYWNKKIKPYLGGKIKYSGMVNRNQLYKYFQKAKATLFPIQWEEPFGMVMTESMACGTPVIAFNRGSVPEVVKNGKTGFIVKNVKEMAAAMKKINSLKRTDCRRYVEKYFSAERMVDNYEKLFLRI